MQKMGSIKIKLNNGAIEVLMAELQPNEMGAIYMLGFGREMPDSVTKYHLTKIIAVLCEKLGWIEMDEHKNSTPQTEHVSDEICRDLGSPSFTGLEKNIIHEPHKNDKKLLENSFVISEVYTQNQAEVKTDLDQHFGEGPLNVGREAEWASEDDSENLSEIDFEASQHDLSHEEMINSSAEIDIVENLPINIKKEDVAQETLFQMSEEDKKKEHRANVKSMVGLENPKKESTSPGIESSPKVGKDCGFEQCEYTSQFTSNVTRHKKRHGHFKQTELEQGQASAKVPVKVEAIQDSGDFQTTPSIAAANATIESEEGIVKSLEIPNKKETPSQQQHLTKTAQYAVPNFVGKNKKEVLLRCPVCNWAMRGSNLYRHVSIKHPKVDISTLHPEKVEPNGASRETLKPVLPRRAKAELRKKPRLTVEKDKANSPVHSLCSKCNLYIHSSNTARHWRMKHTEEVYSPSKMKQNNPKYVMESNIMRMRKINSKARLRKKL